MRSRASLLLGVCCLLFAAPGRAVAASPSDPPRDPSTLGINFGHYDAEEFQRQINEGRIERLELTNTLERLRSYRIEIAELRPGPGRAHVSIFGELISTFSIDPQNDPQTDFRKLIAVESRRVSLDQFGTPIGGNSQILRARLDGAAWVLEQSDGVALKDFPGTLTPSNRRVLFILTGLLRAAPGQPAVPWMSDVTEQLIKMVGSSLLSLVFVKIPDFPILTDLATGAASDTIVDHMVERFKARELRWGASGTISEPSIGDNALLYQTLGQRVWTDPRGFPPGCDNLPGNWKSSAERGLAVHRACLVANPPLPVSCTQTLAQFAEEVYGVYDFYKPASPSEMTPDEILNFVSSTPSRWELLGNSSDESIRQRAQDTANTGSLVIAIRRGDSTQTDQEKRNTKVAFILPGQMVPSGSWGGRVPNSATLATASASESASYVSKSLAFAFNSGANVRLYARKY